MQIGFGKQVFVPQRPAVKPLIQFGNIVKEGVEKEEGKKIVKEADKRQASKPTA